MGFIIIGTYAINVDKIIYFEPEGDWHTKVYMASDNDITIDVHFEEFKNTIEGHIYEDRERRKQSFNPSGGRC